MRNCVYFVDLEKTNVPLLDMILRGEFVALYGARASGKSTRVVQVMEKLKSQSIVSFSKFYLVNCIRYNCVAYISFFLRNIVSFEHFNMDNEDRFWSSLGAELHNNAPKYFGKDDVKSSDDFLLKFHNEQ
jgi:AAA+ ATPase superfamily predicted ATPase